MKFQQNLLIITVVLWLGSGFSSCKKLIEVEPPRNELVTASVFKDSASAVGSILGIYIDMINVSTVLQFGNGALTVYTGLSGDELYPTLNYDPEIEFYHNAISKENGINSDLWTQAYKIIYHANACIDGLSQSTALSNGLNLQLLSEARFVRAFIYFNLIQLYGDVPYITSIGFKSNSVVPRITKAIIVKNIETELVEIIPLLGNHVLVSGNKRPDRYAAMALLAELYLYNHDWDKAIQMATDVIDSGNYAIEPDLLSVFKLHSRESIWNLPSMQPDYETAEAYQFVPGSPDYPPPYAIAPSLLDAFEQNDQRKLFWLDSIRIDGITYYYPFKYTINFDGNSTSEEPYVIFRLTEQYLIRSEAKAQQNIIEESLGDLNIVRVRAGLDAIHFNDQQSLLDAIRHERRVELFCEGGHRWFDLKRTNTIDELSSIKPGWQVTDAIYPIPFNEIQLNPFLTQNPGY